MAVSAKRASQEHLVPINLDLASYPEPLPTEMSKRTQKSRSCLSVKFWKHLLTGTRGVRVPTRTCTPIVVEKNLGSRTSAPFTLPDSGVGTEEKIKVRPNTRGCCTLSNGDGSEDSATRDIQYKLDVVRQTTLVCISKRTRTGYQVRLEPAPLLRLSREAHGVRCSSDPSMRETFAICTMVDSAGDPLVHNALTGSSFVAESRGGEEGADVIYDFEHSIFMCHSLLAKPAGLRFVVLPLPSEDPNHPPEFASVVRACSGVLSVALEEK